MVTAPAKLNKDSVMIHFAATKYWVKWDGPGTAKVTTHLNITRLFYELVKSKRCPDDIKRKLAVKMNNSTAKGWLMSNPDRVPARAQPEVDELLGCE